MSQEMRIVSNKIKAKGLGQSIIKKDIFCLIMVCIIVLSSCTNSAVVTNESSSHKDTTTVKDVENIENYKKQYDAFIENVSDEYAYNIAYELSTNEKFFNSKLGGRNAGSDAEHRTADFLVEKMNEIGLDDVKKSAAKCDKWQFNGASFVVDGKEYQVYTYATAETDEDGITAELVYLNKGTMQDYEGKDVEGKIVLIDIDQRNDWWINYPMLEAQHHGAVAILAANVGGYAQIAGDALNSQDICGPTAIPTLSIGKNDSEELQKKIAEGKVIATLKVDNDVEIGNGTTYNITGRIKGKSSDHQILVGGHYDVHFTGFQDDNCAVGLVLAMAKAFKDSNYEPENDIVFCLHGAEEWGATYSMYDWTVGAWEMINHVHPEWVGKTLAFINFELPAYQFDKYTSTYSAPEMYSMIDYFANKCELSPNPEGCFEDGIVTEGYQTYTYSDDFSYYVAGVPSTVNGFLLQKDMENVFPFYIDIYHSQYDTPETYNKNVMRFNLSYYGAFAMFIDQNPALRLDFTSQYKRITDSMDRELIQSVGVDIDAFDAALSNLNTKAIEMNEKIRNVNSNYFAPNNDDNTKSTIRLDGNKLTDINLSAFKYAQKNLLGLMYEKPIVPHEAPQKNIRICESIIKCLQDGDVVTAVDEYLWTLNNILAWYSMYFSEEVIKIQDDMFWGEGNKNNLYWGTDIGFTKAEVDSIVRSLMKRYDEVNGDFTKEIEAIEKVIDSQKIILKNLCEKEISAINELAMLIG